MLGFILRKLKAIWRPQPVGEPELLLDERISDWPGAPVWDEAIHGEPR